METVSLSNSIISSEINPIALVVDCKVRHEKIINTQWYEKQQEPAYYIIENQPGRVIFKIGAGSTPHKVNN